jgi:ketosteroid isomerase-like protein
MKIRTFTIACVAAFALSFASAAAPADTTPGPSPADLQAALDRMVQAERDFSKASVEKGTRAAFLAYLADDAVLFRPGPVPGRAFTESQPAGTTYLAWRPIHSEIAASGDLGFNTGPFELRPAPDSSEKTYGHFVTIWKKQADGSWKAVLDTGVPTLEPYSGPEGPFTLPSPALPVPAPAAELARTRGPVLAYLATFADTGRLLRSGSQPAVGREALRTALDAQKTRILSWEPQAGEVSKAGDLGYTYGTLESRDTADGPADRAAYTRIWRRQAGRPWKIVLEVATPLPPAAPATPAPAPAPAPPAPTAQPPAGS